MLLSSRVTLLLWTAAAMLAFEAPVLPSQGTPPCPDCAVWNRPQQPLRIFANTYYVGTRGLSSILITSDAGHVLIDGALPESAPLIARSIRELGFRIEDVKWILNSHVHFDHAGGIAELQRLSGATVAASPRSAPVLTSGEVDRSDPQFGIIRPIAPVRQVKTIEEGAVIRVGPVTVTAHSTPGHTPGGTSWTWTSCEGQRCLGLVYVDSITPVSADGFLFSRSTHYPGAVADFERTFSFLESAPCDILITPHPDASGLWERVDQRAGGRADALVDKNACRRYAAVGRKRLQERLAREAG